MDRTEFILFCVICCICIIAIVIVAYQVSIPITLNTESADIVIVGGGTSACIAAFRLSDKYPNKSIIILERGRDRRNDPIVYNIANMDIVGYTPPYSETLPTNFPNTTVSIANMNGGGSSHNFALVVRGSPDFYNQKWYEQLGLSYDDLVNEYFPLIEAYYPLNPNETSPVRFQSGKVQMTQLPVTVDIGSRFWALIGKAFNQGFQLLGQALNILQHHGPLRASDSFSNAVTTAVANTKPVPIVTDYNTQVVTCTATTPQLFIDNVSGIRQSTDVAYLPRSIVRFDKNGNGRGKNIQFVPNATVTNITSNAITWTDGSHTHTTTVKEKVILGAGAIYTPFLLQRSKFNNINIGQNLTTHYGTTMIVAVQPDASETFLFSSGPIAFVPRFSAETERSWQFLVSGSVNSDLLTGVTGIPAGAQLFSFLIWNLKPRVRGTVSIGETGPIVDLNLFSDGSYMDPNSDMTSVMDGLRWLYTLTQQLNTTYPTLIPVYPPLAVLEQNDPVILEAYIKKGLSLTDHYCSTCALGSVVDPNTFALMDHPNIHIIDASTFPQISDGNTNYPVMTMAEIAAQRIIRTY